METVQEIPKELTAPWPINEIAVKTADNRVVIGEQLRDNKSFQNKVKTFFKPLKDKAFAAHKEICKREKEVLKPAEAWETAAKRACITYDDEQERIRSEEQARLEAEARKREEEARLAEAIEAEAKGDKKEAEAILNDPVDPVPVIAPKMAPKVEGQSYSITYKAEVLNIHDLALAVVEGKVSHTAIMPNMSFLNTMARTMKDTMNIPGVKLVKEKGMRVSGK